MSSYTLDIILLLSSLAISKLLLLDSELTPKVKRLIVSFTVETSPPKSTWHYPLTLIFNSFATSSYLALSSLKK